MTTPATTPAATTTPATTEAAAPAAADTTATTPVEGTAAPATAAEATPPPADPASKAFAVIAKKERALIEREKALKAEHAKLEAELKPLREAAEAIRAGNALDGLGKLGIDYASLTKAVLGKPKADPTDAVRAELEALKAKMTEREQREAEAGREHAVATVRAGIEAHVKEKADAYPCLSGTPDGIDHVFALIEKHAQETAAAGRPELLPFDEAASLIEQQLRAGLQTLEPVFRRLFAPGEQAPAAAENATPGTTTAPTTGTDKPATISNEAAAASAHTRSTTPPRTLAEIERERLRRAEQVAARIGTR